MAKANEVLHGTSAKSQEYIVESSSESESEGIVGNKKASQKDTATKLETSSSAEDSETQSNSESASTASSSDSSSKRSSAAKRRPESAEVSKNSTSKKAKTTYTGTPTSRKHPFNPPPGYKPLQLGATDYVTETGNMFVDLNGKQVWHITAPASVPIASIKSLDIPAALRGEPIFRHDGTSYNMFAASSKGEALLVPKDNDGAYSVVNVEISRNFHLRELQPSKSTSSTKDSSHTGSETNGTSEDLGTENSEFVAQQEGATKPPREQPTGLLMRYQPYGSGSSLNQPYKLSDPTIENAEVEANHQNTLVVPALHSDEELVDRTKTPKKKHTKTSKADGLSQGDGLSKEDAMDIDTEHNNAVLSTPHSKVTDSTSKKVSERKRKKERKEKA